MENPPSRPTGGDQNVRSGENYQNVARRSHHEGGAGLHRKAQPHAHRDSQARVAAQLGELHRRLGQLVPGLGGALREQHANTQAAFGGGLRLFQGSDGHGKGQAPQGVPQQPVPAHLPALPLRLRAFQDAQPAQGDSANPATLPHVDSAGIHIPDGAHQHPPQILLGTHVPQRRARLPHGDRHAAGLGAAVRPALPPALHQVPRGALQNIHPGNGAANGLRQWLGGRSALHPKTGALPLGIHQGASQSLGVDGDAPGPHHRTLLPRPSQRGP
mmetsp:Transcript_1810/g.4487  ORF Transcript_1810/g.4487 Transcript_1810/m.4487 type:complete len:272 (+) Transcript_1810:829-1644(+)